MKLKNYIEKLEILLKQEGNLDIYTLEEYYDSDDHTEFVECFLSEGINNPEIYYVEKDNTHDFDKDPYLLHKPLRVLVL